MRIDSIKNNISESDLPQATTQDNWVNELDTIELLKHFKQIKPPEQSYQPKQEQLNPNPSKITLDKENPFTISFLNTDIAAKKIDSKTAQSELPTFDGRLDISDSRLEANKIEKVSKLGVYLAEKQEEVASKRDTIGLCWPAVADVYDTTHPEQVAEGYSAWEASKTFARDKRFKELPNTGQGAVDIDQLTPGTVVVLSPSKEAIAEGRVHGHIFVYLGKGEIVLGDDNRYHFVPQEKMKDPSKAEPIEASDHLEPIKPKDIYDYSKTRIFKPISDQI